MNSITAEEVAKMNRAYFDRFASAYDGSAQSQCFQAPSFVFNKVSGFFFEKPPLKVLDLGIGTGLLSGLFKAAYPDCNITGIDISSKMLAQAKAKGIVDRAYQLDLQVANLPFECGQFDAVISSGVLEFILDPELAISEMARVGKTGAIVCLTTSNEFDSDNHEGTSVIIHNSSISPVVEVIHPQERIYQALKSANCDELTQESFAAYQHNSRDVVDYSAFTGRCP